MEDKIKKTVLITGGSGGIGEELCNFFANKKIKIFFTYFKNKKKANLIIKNIKKNGGLITAKKMDISSIKSIKSTLNYFLKKEKQINILINNSGISQIRPYEKISENDWNNMLNINLKGPFFLTQYFLKKIKFKKWCRVINISSISGIKGGKLQIHYAITKSGLISVTKSLNNIYGKRNFTFNALAPGLINTKMIKKELVSKKVNKDEGFKIKDPKVISRIVNKIISEKYKNISGRVFKV